MMVTALLLSALAGAVWAWTIALGLNILATLIAGSVLDIPLMAAAFSGLCAALGRWALPWRPAHRCSGQAGAGTPFTAIARLWAGGWGEGAAIAGIFAIILCLATFFAPLGANPERSPFATPVVLVLLATLASLAIGATLGELTQGVPTRYRLELALIRLLRGLGLVFLGGVVILPFYAMLMTSFKKQSELLADPLDYSINIASGPAALFSSYIELFSTFHFGRYLLVSALVSTVTVIITLAAAIPGAYAIARLRFPGSAMFSRGILLIYMVPAIVLVIPLYAVFSQLGLRDNLLGLLAVYPATTIPVALYMFQGYFRSIPGELEEAGMMDGCSRLDVIMRITLPLSLPAIASVALYVFMIAWNEFLFAFMFLDTPEIFTLSRAVVSLNSSEVPRQHLMAGAVIVTLPVIALFLWFERFLVAGLTAGSVKG